MNWTETTYMAWNLDDHLQVIRSVHVYREKAKNSKNFESTTNGERWTVNGAWAHRHTRPVRDRNYQPMKNFQQPARAVEFKGKIFLEQWCYFSSFTFTPSAPTFSLSILYVNDRRRVYTGERETTMVMVRGCGAKGRVFVNQEISRCIDISPRVFSFSQRRHIRKNQVFRLSARRRELVYRKYCSILFAFSTSIYYIRTHS